MRNLLILFALSFSILTSNAQGKLSQKSQALLKKAEQYFNDQDYGTAIPIYEDLVDRGSLTAVRRLGDCYRLSNDLLNAGAYYAQAVEQRNLNPIYYYYYAQTLLHEGNYGEARDYLSRFLEHDPGNDMALRMREACDFALSNSEQPEKATLSLLELNTVDNEFGAVNYNGGILYTASSKGGLVKKSEDITMGKLLDIYYTSSSSSKGEPVSGEVNSSNYHEGPACVDDSEEMIYFTRNNATGMRAKTSHSGEVVLNIFEAKGSSGHFRELRELPFNGNEYSCAHPSINKDGDMLYFASDMGGGFGGADIYYSIWDTSKNDWGWPINAGESVNTDRDEYFPFIHESGILFFSSNGHLGYGGLDIFSAVPAGDSILTFENVINLGRPYNSPADDFSFYTDSAGRTGFISSNREGGKGGDDIYSFSVTRKSVHMRDQ